MSSLPMLDRWSEFARRTTAYLAVTDATRRGIANVETTIGAVGDGATRAPVTINHSGRRNAWICSPQTSYSAYAIEELERFGHPLLTTPLALACRAAGRRLESARIDDAVAINNWLISTNVYPALDRAALQGWITEARERWPQQAIWFRSLNARYAADWLEALAAAGAILVPSRQVYLYDRIERDARRPSDLRRDLRLLRETSLVASGSEAWAPRDFERAAELYGLLYLDKYSRLNPDYRAALLQAWSKAGLLRLTGFRAATGELVAVVGLFELDDTVTAPIVGYDTSLPQRLGLYRLLMATVFAHAARTGQRVNLSAGAAGFKRLRGGIAEIEYSAVFARHLPRNRQRSIAALSWLTRRIGVPIMQRFEL